MLLGSVALFFLAAILFAGYPPLLATAQQTAPPITTTTIPPLTPEEQEEQNRLQNVIAATNQNLDEAEKQVGGVVYTPRWSDVVWVEPGALSILFAYCLPGEFAESGQEILGGFELEVLESYEVALPQNFMAWTMVIGNEDRQDRLPAAVGVICASDTNDVETRVLSPQEQQEINNIVQQFITTQVTNIEQVINIINNVTTTNATTTGGPVTPPPPTNDTGGTTPPPGGGGGVGPRPPGGGAGGIPENATAEREDRIPPVLQLSSPNVIFSPIDPDDAPFFAASADDNIDGQALLDTSNILKQDNIGGPISISCNPTSGSVLPQGVTIAQCTAVDAAGNTVQKSFTITVLPPSPPPTGGGGLPGPQVPGGVGGGILGENPTVETDRTPPKILKSALSKYEIFDPAGAVVLWRAYAADDVDGEAILESIAGNDVLVQDGYIGGDIDISCDPSPSSLFPVGVTTVQCTATDASDNIGTASFTITVELVTPPTEGALVGEQPPAAIEEQQQLPAADEGEAPVQEEEQPPAEEAPPTAEEEEEAATTPPANGAGGG
jgi:hypothetical protein